MKIAIFGSCVSRDTAELIPEAEVAAYIARQSFTSIQTPHGTDSVDLSALKSEFQRRMVLSDLNGSGIDRIVKNKRDLDIVLLDLIDERRGFWEFVDGTTMTNSIEAESCGATESARSEGARLIEFGTDRHFNRWQSAFAMLVRGLKDAELWDRTIFLDLEWAAAVDGARQPISYETVQLRRLARSTRRRMQLGKEAIAQGSNRGVVRRRARSIQPTESEAFALRALKANNDYRRYRKYAHSMVENAVVRKSSELRIDPEHKWGPQPFHYTLSNYQSVGEEILEAADNFG